MTTSHQLFTYLTFSSQRSQCWPSFSRLFGRLLYTFSPAWSRSRVIATASRIASPTRNKLGHLFCQHVGPRRARPFRFRSRRTRGFCRVPHFMCVKVTSRLVFYGLLNDSEGHTSLCSPSFSVGQVFYDYKNCYN